MHVDYFQTWLKPNFNYLLKGQKILWPAFLGHPIDHEFTEIKWAEGVHGKSRDWALSIPGGRRLHVWEFNDGTFKIHLDRFDPAQGQLVAHLFSESAVFKSLIMVGLAVAAARYFSEN